MIACLSVLYAPAFVVYLSRLHELMREHTDPEQVPAHLVARRGRRGGGRCDRLTSPLQGVSV
jgi:hypothetical protein